MRLSAPFAALALAALLALPAGADDTVAVTPRQAGEERPAQGSHTALPFEVHGEVSAMVASDGSKAITGSVVIPLGDKGELAIAGETGRYGGATGPYAWDAFGPFSAPPPVGTPAACGSVRPTGLPQLPSCDTQN